MFKKITVVLLLIVLATTGSYASLLDVIPDTNIKTEISCYTAPVRPQEGLVTTVDISGSESWDSLGDPDNQSIDIDLGAILGCPGEDVYVSAVGWDVLIETIPGAWASEAVISLGGAVYVIPGVGDNNSTPPGGTNYNSGGLFDLTMVDSNNDGIPDMDLSFIASGGILTLEFFQFFDNVPDALDTSYLDPSSLSFEIEKVPEPSSFALFAIAMLGSLSLRTRKQRS